MKWRKLRLPALAISAVFAVMLIISLVNTDWAVSDIEPVEPTTSFLAIELFSEGGFILPVELAAVLMLAAILGAVVMVRDK